MLIRNLNNFSPTLRCTLFNKKNTNVLLKMGFWHHKNNIFNITLDEMKYII